MKFVKGRRVDAPDGGLRQALAKRLRTAQKIRDWVRVADYLEYEVDPLLADWTSRIAKVRKTCSQAV